MGQNLLSVVMIILCGKVKKGGSGLYQAFHLVEKGEGAVALRKNFRNATAIFRIQAVHFFLFSFSEEKRKRKKELFRKSWAFRLKFR
ncbi:MAG: hypothetical protein IJC71_06965, partial [Clostridia bacterium]|nr:hypothetical protein [Clostridia bacterium]